MNDNSNTNKHDKISTLFDVQLAFERIRALCAVLLEYEINFFLCYDDKNKLIKQDNIYFTLMAIHECAQKYENQVRDLQSGNEISPIKEDT